MTVIKARCPTCGNLEMSPPDFHLQTYDRGGRDYYEFICPKCDELVVKQADARIIATLRTGRVPETRIFLPIEALDPKREEGVSLTYDDLLDFCLELGETDDPSSAQ